MLEYQTAYHLHCQLRLQSGRTITLWSIDQEMTYAGLLEGTPDAVSNDRRIKSALVDAQRRCVAGQPYLIVPPRRDYFRKPGDMNAVARQFPERVPEWLPLVRCIGSFKDVVPARDSNRDLSVLVVVWFQDEFALPIQRPALDKLQELDWTKLATDVDI